MRYVAPLLILAIGCGQSEPPAPQRARLVLADLEIREEEVPTRVVFQVENRGDAAAAIDSIHLGISGLSILHDRTLPAPDNLNYRIVMLDANDQPLPDAATVNVAPGETTRIVAELQWRFPDDAPPMLAVVQASFGLWVDGKPRIVTDVAAFTMQSEPQAADAVVALVADSADNRRELLATLNRLSGTPSPGFTALRNRLSEGESP